MESHRFLKMIEDIPVPVKDSNSSWDVQLGEMDISLRRTLTSIRVADKSFTTNRAGLFGNLKDRGSLAPYSSPKGVEIAEVVESSVQALPNMGKAVLKLKGELAQSGEAVEVFSEASEFFDDGPFFDAPFITEAVSGWKILRELHKGVKEDNGINWDGRSRLSFVKSLAIVKRYGVVSLASFAGAKVGAAVGGTVGGISGAAGDVASSGATLGTGTAVGTGAGALIGGAVGGLTGAAAGWYTNRKLGDRYEELAMRALKLDPLSAQYLLHRRLIDSTASRYHDVGNFTDSLDNRWLNFNKMAWAEIQPEEEKMA